MATYTYEQIYSDPKKAIIRSSSDAALVGLRNGQEVSVVCDRKWGEFTPSAMLIKCYVSANKTAQDVRLGKPLLDEDGSEIFQNTDSDFLVPTMLGHSGTTWYKSNVVAIAITDGDLAYGNSSVHLVYTYPDPITVASVSNTTTYVTAVYLYKSPIPYIIGYLHSSSGSAMMSQGSTLGVYTSIPAGGPYPHGYKANRVYQILDVIGRPDGSYEVDPVKLDKSQFEFVGNDTVLELKYNGASDVRVFCVIYTIGDVKTAYFSSDKSDKWISSTSAYYTLYDENGNVIPSKGDPARSYRVYKILNSSDKDMTVRFDTYQALIPTNSTTQFEISIQNKQSGVSTKANRVLYVE